MSVNYEQIKQSVITVGDGRGFIIEAAHARRCVVTAAHCLPFFPPCDTGSYVEERLYKALLAPLGAPLAVSAECLFVDPIADIAVLGKPDDQEFGEQAEAYEALTESVEPITIAEVTHSTADEESPAWLLSLDGRWFCCSVAYLPQVDGPYWIRKTEQPIQAGMSGSPIISETGAAIGVVTLCTDGRCEDEYGAPNARLMRDLPRRFLTL